MTQKNIRKNVMIQNEKLSENLKYHVSIDDICVFKRSACQNFRELF